MDYDPQNWWKIAIERQRAALLPIVTTLFFMAGLDEGGAETLPWRVYRRILLVLRPAETALRRLIMAAAHGLVVTVRTPRPATPRNVPWWAVKRPAPAVAGKPASPETGRLASSALVIAAPVEPRAARPKKIPARDICRRFGLAWSGPLPKPPSVPDPDNPLGSIPAFQLFDPLKRFDLQLSPRGGAPWPGFPAESSLAGDEEIGAVALCRRVAALKSAYDDMDGQAIRLARWQARRRHVRASGGTVRPRRLSPMRAGWPPGWRKRPIHAIDGILRECDLIARNPPARAIDTS